MKNETYGDLVNRGITPSDPPPITELLKRREQDVREGRLTVFTHTPGPWEVDRGHVYEAAVRETFTTTCDDGREHISRRGLVALVYERYGVVDNTDGANARLIAAAPDLLAACKAVLKDIEVEQGASVLPEIHDALKAAVAKAEEHA